MEEAAKAKKQHKKKRDFTLPNTNHSTLIMGRWLWKRRAIPLCSMAGGKKKVLKRLTGLARAAVFLLGGCLRRFRQSAAIGDECGLANERPLAQVLSKFFPNFPMDVRLAAAAIHDENYAASFGWKSGLQATARLFSSDCTSMLQSANGRK